MKRLLSYFLPILICLASFLICQQALAVDVGLNYVGTSGLGQEDVRITIAQFIQTSLGILAMVFIVVLMAGGIYYWSNKNDTEKVLKAKKIIISAVIGLVIILTAVSIVSYILSQLIGLQQGGGQENTNTNQNNNTNENQNFNSNNNQNNNTNNNVNNNTNSPFAVNYVCDGDMPENAILCTGDDQNLTGPTARMLIAECTDTAKCEYICTQGFNYTDGVCFPACTGKNIANATLCSYDDMDLTAPAPKISVAECTDETKCEFKCNSGFMASNNSCVPNPFTCQGPTISNAHICSGDDKNLTTNLDKLVVSKCTTSRKCEYLCDSTFIMSNNSCVPNPYICKGSDFADATLCPGSDIDLPADTNKVLMAGGCAEVKCSYACDFGYGKSGVSCAAIKYATITVDNEYDLYVNGALIGHDDDWYHAEIYDIGDKLIVGDNVIAIKGVDKGGGYGIIAKFGNGSQIYTATSINGWKCINRLKTTNDPAGWQNNAFNDSGWPAAILAPTITAWPVNINMPGAEWIWSASGQQNTKALCRYHFTL